jgi:hypothetical protein
MPKYSLPGQWVNKNHIDLGRNIKLVGKAYKKLITNGKM